MWGSKHRETEARYASRAPVNGGVRPNYARGRTWRGTRYEYLFLPGLPLGDSDQRHLTAAGAHGWRVVQVGIEESALGHATGVWALLERELPSVVQSDVDGYGLRTDQVYDGYSAGHHTRHDEDAFIYHRPSGAGPSDGVGK